MTSELPPDWQPQYVVQPNVPLKSALCHDGHLVTGLDTQQLRRHVLRYLKSIDFLPANFFSYFDTAVCRAQPSASRLCRFVDDEAPALLREPRVVRLGDVLHGLTTGSKWMANWIATGKKHVPQEEAQRRANICLRCPYNVELGGCSGCVDFVGKLTSRIGGLTVEGISNMKACAICACSLPALVWVPMEALDEENGLPSFCWKRK